MTNPLFLLLGLLLLLTTPTDANRKQAIWSSQPLTEARLLVEDIWLDVDDTVVDFVLQNEAPVLLNYAITLRSFKPENSASDFLIDETMSSGQKDFVQVRMTVDNVPLRQVSLFEFILKDSTHPH